MRRLTDQERMALVEVGEPGEGPVSESTFAECIRMGWGYWGRDSGWRGWFGGKLWFVTAAGKRAKELDDLARGST